MSEMKKTFENSMSELEGVVRKLESGDLSLDDSIKEFESGMRLAAECEKKLGEAKGKVEKLIKDAQGNAKVEKFEVKE